MLPPPLPYVSHPSIHPCSHLTIHPLLASGALRSRMTAIPWSHYGWSGPSPTPPPTDGGPYRTPSDGWGKRKGWSTVKKCFEGTGIRDMTVVWMSHFFSSQIPLIFTMYIMWQWSLSLPSSLCAIFKPCIFKAVYSKKKIKSVLICWLGAKKPFKPKICTQMLESSSVQTV